MQELNILLPGIMSVLSLAAILVVLLFTILRLLRTASFFTGKMAVIISLCTALLFIVGVSQLLLVPGGMPNIADAHSGAGVTVNYLLLPCLALTVAAAVVLSQVLLLASRMPPSGEFSNGDRETDAKESEHSLVKPKPAGRPKKEKAAEKESKEAAEPADSVL